MELPICHFANSMLMISFFSRECEAHWQCHWCSPPSKWCTKLEYFDWIHHQCLSPNHSKPKAMQLLPLSRSRHLLKLNISLNIATRSNMVVYLGVTFSHNLTRTSHNCMSFLYHSFIVYHYMHNTMYFTQVDSAISLVLFFLMAVYAYLLLHMKNKRQAYTQLKSLTRSKFCWAFSSNQEMTEALAICYWVQIYLRAKML